MSTEIDELKQARYRSGKTISGHNAFLRPPTGETNSVDTRGFHFVLKEPHPKLMDVVFAAAVMELLLKAPERLASVFRVKFSAIPAGNPLNVSRILVPFPTGEPLFELCEPVRKSE